MSDNNEQLVVADGTGSAKESKSVANAADASAAPAEQPKTEKELRLEREARLKRIEEKRARSKEEFFEKQASSDGIFRRPKVVRREVFGDSAKVELVEFDEVRACKGAPFVCGMPGKNSMTSLLAAGFFAKQLELPTVACLRVRGAAPEGIVKDNDPGLQLRIMGDSRMCVLYSETPLKGGGTTFNLNRALLSFCERHAVSHLCIVDGVPTDPTVLKNEVEAKQLRFLTTSEAFSKHMRAGGHIAVMNAIMPGFAGQLLADATVADGLAVTDISCVLAKTDPHFPSANSAVHVVRALDSFFDGFTIDMSDLEDSALEMEQAVTEAIEDAKQKMAAAGTMPNARAAPTNMYM